MRSGRSMKHANMGVQVRFEAAPASGQVAPSQRRAFSLIELLVVISIIALLASMLLPVVDMVRRSAIKSKCASQMRQIHLAVIAYANDQEGILNPVWVSSAYAPPEWGYAPVGSPVVYWATPLLGQYIDGFEQLPPESLPKNKYRSVVKCPATRRTDGRDWEGTMSLNTTYCAFINGPWTSSNVVPLSRVAKSSATVLLIDGSRPFWSPYASGGYPAGMNGNWWPWHGGSGANLLHFDGHTAFTTNASAEFITGKSFAL